MPAPTRDRVERLVLDLGAKPDDHWRHHASEPEYHGVVCHDSTRGDYTLVIEDPAQQHYSVYGGLLPTPTLS